MTKICRNCGTENAADVVFCSVCGMSLLKRAPVGEEAVRRMGSKDAMNWYLWLWLSPLVTVPSLAFIYFLGDALSVRLICGGEWLDCNHAAVERVALLIAVLGSALWHLILLLPALVAKSQFVRWHGRQALFLAGLRTAVPLMSALVFGVGGVCLANLIQLPIYVLGNLWGQRQATRGDCSLMRWFGRAEALPLPEPVAVPEEAPGVGPEALVETIRYSRDHEERKKALLELGELGMVESLGDAPASTVVPTTSVVTPGTASASRRNPLVFLVGGAGALLALLCMLAVVLSAPFVGTLIPPPPTPTPTYLEQAQFHSFRGQYEEAIANYTEAIRLDPQNRRAYYGRGNAYAELGDYEEAVADYSQAIRLDPNQPGAYYSRGVVLSYQGQYEEAVADYREALVLSPTYASAYNNLAWTLAHDLDTDYEEALEYALRAVELDPDEYHHDTLAMVYCKLEQYDEALDHYYLALSLDPHFAASYRGRADVYLALGDHQSALEDYERYLDLEPEASDRQAVEETIDWLQGQAE